MYSFNINSIFNSENNNYENNNYENNYFSNNPSSEYYPVEVSDNSYDRRRYIYGEPAPLLKGNIYANLAIQFPNPIKSSPINITKKDLSTNTFVPVYFGEKILESTEKMEIENSDYEEIEHYSLEEDIQMAELNSAKPSCAEMIRKALSPAEIPQQELARSRFKKDFASLISTPSNEGTNKENAGLLKIKTNYKNAIQEKNSICSNQDKNGVIPQKIAFSLSYAQIAQKKPLIQVFGDNSLSQSKPKFKYEHENGIFGSYCLEDVKAIDKLVYKHFKSANLSYDCFNYETVNELTDENGIHEKNHPGANIRELFQTNLRILNNLQSKEALSFNLHYIDQPNDLLQTRNKLVDSSENWDKFNRHFQQNMFFFNPYLKNGKNTTKLMKRFFSYAKTNLDNNGVVTLMWNYDRQDSLRCVKITQIALEKGFKVIKKLSGKQFARLTNFKHLKNSTSLARAIEESSDSVYVSAKQTDVLLMFKKIKSSSIIPSENVIATVMSENLDELDIIIE